MRVNNPRIVIRINYLIQVAKHKYVKNEIKRMIELAIIKSSISSFCNPIRVVNQKDGRVIICLDRSFIIKILDPEHDGLRQK